MITKREIFVPCEDRPRDGRCVQVVSGRCDGVAPARIANQRKSVSGGTYFIWAEGTDRMKIGFAKSIRSRVRDLGCGSAFPLRPVVVVPRDQERSLHLLFEDFRVRASDMGKEWFTLSCHMVDFLADVEGWKDEKLLGALIDHYRADGPSVTCGCGCLSLDYKERAKSMCPGVADWADPRWGSFQRKYREALLHAPCIEENPREAAQPLRWRSPPLAVEEHWFDRIEKTASCEP